MLAMLAAVAHVSSRMRRTPESLRFDAKTTSAIAAEFTANPEVICVLCQDGRLLVLDMKGKILHRLVASVKGRGELALDAKVVNPVYSYPGRIGSDGR